MPKELWNLAQDYRITVYDIAFLDDSVIERFRSDFRVVAKFFKHRRFGMEHIALQDDMELKHVEAVLGMLSAFTGDNRYENAYEEHLKEKVERGEKIAVCKGIQYWEDKGIEKGIKKGIEQMLANGKTPEQICDFCNYDLELVRHVQRSMAENGGDRA